MRLIVALIVVLSGWLAAAVQASETPDLARCDCSKLIGPCQGTARYSEHWLHVGSSSMRCSLVDIHTADNKIVQFKVTDGIARHPWLAGGVKDTGVGRCHICVDKQFDLVDQLTGKQTIPLAEQSALDKDLSWLNGTWCWDWYGRPGKNTYQQIKDGRFKWGDNMEHEITLKGDIMTVVDSMGATFERQVFDRQTMLWTKRAYKHHSEDENVKMWRCD